MRTDLALRSGTAVFRCPNPKCGHEEIQGAAAEVAHWCSVNGKRVLVTLRRQP